jgi:RNA recognition motif-containing protein
MQPLHLPLTPDVDRCRPKAKVRGLWQHVSATNPPAGPSALWRAARRDRAAWDRSRAARPARDRAAARGARRWRSARRVATSVARSPARLARASPNPARAPAPPRTHPPAYHALVSLTAQAGVTCSLSHIIMKDRATGLSKGFGFVSFNNPESARNAIQGK